MVRDVHHTVRARETKMLTSKQLKTCASIPVIAWALSAGVASAEQSAPEDTAVEEVVVTGYRASLANAISAKRLAKGVTDSIKAEDIADFPDLNLAESLQRIPGVAITRANGEGRQISVRGLGSEYTRVRINGMEAMATTGGTNNSGGTNRSRGFDFNVFASELFNSLTVRKSASADVEEGSLGATVDLDTARPFDYRKPTLVVSVQGSYNDLARDMKPRFTALASRTWADGKLGALVSVAYEKRHLFEEGANTTRWAFGGASGGFNAASTVAGLTLAQINETDTSKAIFHPRTPGYIRYDFNTERLGITGSLQYRPSADTLLTLDVLASTSDGVRDEYNLGNLSFTRTGAGKPATIIRSGTVDANRNLIKGVFDNVDIRTQAAHDELSTKFRQISLTGEHHFSDKLKGGFSVGHASSKFNNPVSTIITFDRIDSKGYSWDFTSRLPTLNQGFDTTNPANWSMTNGTSEVRIRPNSVDNGFTSGKVFAVYELNNELSLKAGVDYREFEYESQGRRRRTETQVNTLSAADLAAVSTVFSGFGRNLNLPAGNATGWVVPDLNKFIDKYDIYCNCGIYELTGVENSSARGEFRTITEKNTGFYAQLDYNKQVFGLPMRGDVGLRYVETDQASTGYTAVGSSIELVTAERKYNTLLPSANLAIDVTDQFVIRAAAAKTIARASIQALSPGGDISVQGGNRSFSRGNPDIKPTESKNVDLSFEWYPDNGSVLALGLFYKNISTFVQSLRQDIPFNQLGLPTALLDGTGVAATEVFLVSQPVNTAGGELKGFEINMQKNLDFLPGFLRNFGVQTNYTYVDSDMEYLTSTTPGAPTVNQTLVGLSKHAANATLYYETERFSIRGSVAYRQGYLTQVPGSEGNDVQGTNSTTNFDMSASYNVTDKLKLTFEGINLSDEINDQYVDSSNRMSVYSHTGRQFFVGLRYQF